MSEPFDKITITLSNGAKNYRALISGTINVNTGAVNYAEITGNLVLGGGTNDMDARVNGNVTINSGTNEAYIDGNLVMNGGTNTATSFVTQNVTLNGGNNHAFVSGNLYINGGNNYGTVAGNLIAHGGTLAATFVYGDITLGAGVGLGFVDNILNYTGTITYRGTGDSLYSVYYDGGVAGTPQALEGTFYNLENDSKAYTYADGSKSLFTGNAYNLTGDFRAYSWSSGVKGNLYTGYIGNAYYNAGVLDMNATPQFTEHTVTGDSNSGKLYTAYAGSLAANDIYTSSQLTTKYTGRFIYSDTYYMADTGVASLFSGAAIKIVNSQNVYTEVSDGVLGTTAASGIIEFFNDNLYYSFPGDNTKSLFNGAINPGDGQYYTVAAGVKEATATFTGAYLNADGSYYEVANGTATTDLANQIYKSALDGLYYLFVNGVIAENPASVGAVINPNNNNLYYSIYNGVLNNPFTGAYKHTDNLYYNIDNGAPSTSVYASGLRMLASDGVYYNFTDANGATLPDPFTGAGSFDATNYVNIDSGVLGAEASGLRIFADDGLYYNFPGDGTKPLIAYSGAIALNNGADYYTIETGVIESTPTFTGAALGGDGKFYSVVNGSPTSNLASGLLRYAYGGLYHLFTTAISDAGTLPNPFTGAYFNATNYLNVDEGALTANYAIGPRILAGDGLYYNFTGDGTTLPSAFNGAVLVGSVYYTVTNGEIEQTATFTGAYLNDDGSYYEVVEGAPSTTNYANGLRTLASDRLIYNFSNGSKPADAASIGARVVGNGYYRIIDGAVNTNYPFTGAYLGGDGYYYNVNGETPTNTYASGIRMLADNGLFYEFLGVQTNVLPSLANRGALDVNGTYYRIINGVADINSPFTGAYTFTNGYYYNVDNGEPNFSNASGIRMLADNGLFYGFLGVETNVLPDLANRGALNVSGTYYNIVNGIADTSSPFTGAYHFGGGSYRIVSNGVPLVNGANGLHMLDSDGLYYYFSNGSKPADAANIGARIVGSTYYSIIVGIVHTNSPFTGAYLNDDGSYYEVVEGVPSTTNYANGLTMLASNGLYYNFPGNGTKPAEGASIGARVVGSTYYRIIAGLVDTNSPFNGAYQGDYGYYYPVDNGAPVNAYASGIRMFADNGLFYEFSGTAINTLPGLTSDAAVPIGTTYYNITDGAITTEHASGLRMLISGNLVVDKYYNFPGDGTKPEVAASIGARAVDGAYYRIIDGAVNTNYPFTGAYLGGDGYYYNVYAGTTTMGIASGLSMFADNGRLYNFPGTSTNILPEPLSGVVAYFDGSYYDVTNGLITTGYASGFKLNFDDGLYYNFPGNGTKPENPASMAVVAVNGTYYNITNGAVTSDHASGLKVLVSDGLYYNFPGNGLAGSLSSNGAAYDGSSTYYNITNGQVTSNQASGLRIFADDGLYYNFPGDGTKPEVAASIGARIVGSTYYRIIGGVVDTNSPFNGVYLNSDGYYYYNVIEGVPYSSNPSGILMFADNGLLYEFSGGLQINTLPSPLSGVAAGVFQNELYIYVTIADGLYTDTPPNGFMRYINNGLFYNFSGDGTLPDPFTGLDSGFIYHEGNLIGQASQTEVYEYCGNTGARSKIAYTNSLSTVDSVPVFVLLLQSYTNDEWVDVNTLYVGTFGYNSTYIYTVGSDGYISSYTFCE